MNYTSAKQHGHATLQNCNLQMFSIIPGNTYWAKPNEKVKGSEGELTDMLIMLSCKCLCDNMQWFEDWNVYYLLYVLKLAQQKISRSATDTQAHVAVFLTSNSYQNCKTISTIIRGFNFQKTKDTNETSAVSNQI